MRMLINTSLAAAVLATTAFATPLAAGAVDTIRARITSYRAMGAAFKVINDTLRTDTPDLRAIRRAVGTINQTARHQYHWFPAGSDATSGQRTKAKAEIWSNPAGFRSAQDAFAAQAVLLNRAARSGNVEAIRAESRKLGGTCKQCHDQFRAPND